ncbi:MAG: type II toxin-antitoxin system RelE/ParE family toxin [Chitinophagales bacterium]|nr:type II toxin-antitoxin system RelE/ParE family toxin [Chitinophagales bacterium]
MKLKIVFHKEALSDLEEIWLYTLETWSLEQADRYYELIIKEIDFLSKKPKSGKSLNLLREGYYSTKVKSHFLFYKFSATELEIVRILHESMDIPNRL